MPRDIPVVLVAGATLGGALGTLSGGRRAGIGAAVVGAALGSACAYVLSQRWAEEEEAPLRTFADVAREDAEFREAASEEAFDVAMEASALHSLFEGPSSAALAEACTALNTTAKLAEARSLYLTWSDVHRPKLGAAVHAVIDELDAPHLKPSGIEQRLQNGVAASCFGVFQLMNNLGRPPPCA